MTVVKLLNAGRLQYLQGLKLQNHLREQVKKDHFAGVLITIEHNPVYTVGIRNSIYTEKEEERLRKLGADFYKTNRGGLITFHGPGQLVAYPILNLKFFKPSVRWYVHSLEQTIIKLCSQFSLDATTSSLTGVWVNDKKICAIGVHVSNFMTTHGLALNCNTEMNWFSYIVPCGIPDKGVTSLSELLNYNISVEQVLPIFYECFQNSFKCSIEAYSLEESKSIVQTLSNDGVIFKKVQLQ